MKNPAILFLASIVVMTGLSACGNSPENRQLAKKEEKIEDSADKKKDQIDKQAKEDKKAIDDSADKKKDAIDATVKKEKAKIDKQKEANNKADDKKDDGK